MFRNKVLQFNIVDYMDYISWKHGLVPLLGEGGGGPFLFDKQYCQTSTVECSVDILIGQKAFGGLVIYSALAGNITRYSWEIYSQLKSLL